MGNVKISQLPVVTHVLADSVLPIVQSGVTSQVDIKHLTNEYIRKSAHNVFTVSATSTVNLSTDVSVNIILVANPGLTLTIQFPTSPLESEVVQFTTLDNTVTIVQGTGTFYPAYSGAPTSGFSTTYVYHIENTTWYKIS
jgi:hypothetical protein